jgi:PPP family 3-phenylpropionic acid transporter
MAILAALGLLPAHGFWPLFAIACFQAAALAPTTTLADALALHASHARFEYGWVRGAGSAAFVLGTLLAGQMLALSVMDSSVLVWAHAALLGAAMISVAFVPGIPRGQAQQTVTSRSMTGGLREVLGSRSFRFVFAVAALVLGSHAMHDAFASAGIPRASVRPPSACCGPKRLPLRCLSFFFSDHGSSAVLAREVPSRSLPLPAAFDGS